MSKKKGKNGKPTAAKAAVDKATKAEPKVSQVELNALRKPVEEAKGKLEKVQAEAKALAEKANGQVLEAKDAYRAVLALYREACHRAGVECEFEGGRSANVSEKVSFTVEKTDKGVRVAVKGKPNTAETIPFVALKESVNREAYKYVEAHIGPREKVGNKGGSLSNRLRAVLNA